MIRIQNLSVQIRDQSILQAVNLDLAPGTITGLVGESGSGKSVTALALMGLLPHGARASGKILLDQRDILTTPEAQMCKIRGREIGMIFQEPMTALNPLMTIGDQVAETLLTHGGMPRAKAMEMARDRLNRVGLTEPRFPLDLYPHQLSGGQRQRVAIALAIALRPRLLIADEPTTALDVTTQAQILDLLRGLVRDEGMALLLITHDLAVVSGMADQVAVMKSGELVETGQTEALFRTQSHPYTRQLFAASRHVPDQVASAGDVPLLNVQNVVRSYTLPHGVDLRAVDNVSMSIAHGESVGLVGESGCGKSTLTRAILGLDPIQSGRILLDGKAVLAGRQMPHEMRAKMQVVFQDPFGSFNPRWRVERLVAEPFHLTRKPSDWRDRVATALEEVGLKRSDAGKYVHEFSGGQRQRIAIARALIIRPKLIVLDEAVSALDVRVRAQVLDLLTELRRNRDIAYLFISHDLSVVRGITERVLVMKSGQIVESGPSQQVIDAPRDRYTQKLIAATPRIPEDWLTG